VLGAIAQSRALTVAQRQEYGGTGPLTPEPGFDTTDPSAPFCPQSN
jgi:hypothetical protein